MEGKIKIVITDDHALFRKGLKSLLTEFSFIGEILEAANGVELLNLMAQEVEKPDWLTTHVRFLHYFNQNPGEFPANSQNREFKILF